VTAFDHRAFLDRLQAEMDDPARVLWFAVVLRAIADATEPTVAGEHLHAEHRLQAQQWLTTPNEDFDAVCALAGCEPDQVRAYAKQRIANASPLTNPRTRKKIGKQYYELNGRVLSLKEWARLTGIKPNTIRNRLQNGWTMEHAVTTPTQTKQGARRAKNNRGRVKTFQSRQETGACPVARYFPETEIPLRQPHDDYR
jgi:hypothetical protein